MGPKRRAFPETMTLHFSRVFALLGLLLPCVACDQLTKVLAIDHLKGAGEVRVVDGVLRLVYAENPGAFLGLGSHLPDAWRVVLFVGAAALLLCGVAFFVAKSARAQIAPALFVGLALLVGGGVGNLVDRVVRDGGRVVDFAQLSAPAPFSGLHTGIFNVADVQIMLGAAVVALAFRARKTPPAPSAATS